MPPSCGPVRFSPPPEEQRSVSTVHLVRHGQASFGAADYDQLSELGQRQCRRLGQYFAERGQGFDVLWTGSLRRHRQSAEAIADGLGGLPVAEVLPELNEYDSEALIAALLPQAELERLKADRSPQAYREHFRLLRSALQAWMDGQIVPVGMPSWADFQDGIVAALDRARADLHGQRLLIVSSGGPIATAVAAVLAAPTTTAIELNLRIRNSSVTEFAFTPKRHMLVTYNTLPHLDDASYKDWVTYS